jgi:hypothetical protein
MPQVSLYLDQDVLDTARLNARSEGISLSKYVTHALARNADSSWPHGYWELFGALTDESFVYPEDVPFNQVNSHVVFS